MFEQASQPRFVMPSNAIDSNERFYLRDTDGRYIGKQGSNAGTFGPDCRFSIETRTDNDGLPYIQVNSIKLTQADYAAINQLPIMWWYTLYEHKRVGTWMVLQCQYNPLCTNQLSDGLGKTGV